jgi:hypothetical protein
MSAERLEQKARTRRLEAAELERKWREYVAQRDAEQVAS